MDSALVLSLCKKYGPQLALPKGAIWHSVALMCAFAQKESSFGANCVPRHEPAYDRGGKYDRFAQAILLDRYGSAAAYSYGIWQTLPVNALGISPDALNRDPEVQAQVFVNDFNRRVLPKAHTIGEMGQVYNSGHVAKFPEKPLPSVVRYIAELRQNYVEWFAKLQSEADGNALSNA